MRASDMSLQMRRLIRIFRSDRGKIVAALLAGGQSDPELIEAFRERFLLPTTQTGLSNSAARYRPRRIAEARTSI